MGDEYRQLYRFVFSVDCYRKLQFFSNHDIRGANGSLKMHVSSVKIPIESFEKKSYMPTNVNTKYKLKIIVI